MFLTSNQASHFCLNTIPAGFCKLTVTLCRSFFGYLSSCYCWIDRPFCFLVLMSSMDQAVLHLVIRLKCLSASSNEIAKKRDSSFPFMCFSFCWLTFSHSHFKRDPLDRWTAFSCWYNLQFYYVWFVLIYQSELSRLFEHYEAKWAEVPKKAVYFSFFSPGKLLNATSSNLQIRWPKSGRRNHVNYI